MVDNKRCSDLYAEITDLFKRIALEVSLKTVDRRRIKELCSEGTSLLKKANKRKETLK